MQTTMPAANATALSGYRHYVLAYIYLWSNSSGKAIEQLSMIKNPAMLRYAQTSPKFEKLFTNAAFLQMTSVEKKR